VGKATRLLRQAIELVRAKRHQDAVEVYLQAVEADPADGRGWLGLGVCLFRVGNLDVARLALQRAKRQGIAKAEQVLSRVEKAREGRAARLTGAAATIPSGKAATEGAAVTAAAVGAPARRPGEQIDIGRPLRVMLVENIEEHRDAIREAIERTVSQVEVDPLPFGVSSSETMSTRVRHDVAVLDWDSDPYAAAGLIQVLKIKRPGVLIICLTREWDPGMSAKILEAGADYHLAKAPQFATVIPLIIARWAERDQAVIREHEARQAVGAAGDWAQSLNALDEMIMLVGSDLTVRRVNRAATDGLGKSEEGLVGHPYAQPLYGSEQPPESCPILRALQQEVPASGELYSEGQQKTFYAQAWPVLGDDGNTSGVISILHEQGLAAGAREAPSNEAERLASILDPGLDSLDCGLVALDAEGCITWANSLAAKLLLTDKSALRGVNYVELLTECVQECVEGFHDFIESLQGAYERGENVTGYPLRISIEAESETLNYYSTLVEGGTAEVHRIEHFYPAGEAVPGAPAAQNDLVAAVSEMLFSTDAEGRIAWCNPAAATVTGYSEGALRGKALTDLAVPDDRQRLQELLQGAMSDGQEVRNEEVLIMRAGGDSFNAELTLLPERAAEEVELRGVNGILRDVTDRKTLDAVRAVLSGQRTD